MNSCGRGSCFDSYSNFGGGREAWPVSQTEYRLMRSELNLLKEKVTTFSSGSAGFFGRGERVDFSARLKQANNSRHFQVYFTKDSRQADRADVTSFSLEAGHAETF